MKQLNCLHYSFHLNLIKLKKTDYTPFITFKCICIVYLYKETETKALDIYQVENTFMCDKLLMYLLDSKMHFFGGHNLD